MPIHSEFDQLARVCFDILSKKSGRGAFSKSFCTKPILLKSSIDTRINHTKWTMVWLSKFARDTTCVGNNVYVFAQKDSSKLATVKLRSIDMGRWCVADTSYCLCINLKKKCWEKKRKSSFKYTRSMYICSNSTNAPIINVYQVITSGILPF